ncbi:exosome nuclease subunit [Oleoguttula sp. CCFEE 5521]
MDDFPTLQSTLTSALLDTTRSAIALAAEDLPFHRTIDSSLASALDAQNARLLSLTNRLLGSATAHADHVRPTLRDMDDVENNWAKVVDVVDSLLERADTALDDFTGAVKRLSPREQTPVGKVATRPSRVSAAVRVQDIEKPQLLFDHVPSNRGNAPFRPLLSHKPHATVPLDTAPVATDEETASQYVAHLLIYSELGLDHKYVKLKRGRHVKYLEAYFGHRFPHPYQLEIEQYRYPAEVYTHAEPIRYHPFESTTATFVDTEEALYEMLEELKKVKLIAIDLEHHDQRSYIGIVSLMQISTRDRDWIVDTLKPWRRKLQCLNEVFADPSVVKVLHGAHMDSIWLQRDLGLYLVGLFDTHHASRALGYPGGSYAYLLQRFTGVQAQKQYQTADWRMRPLSKELLDYARSDTHYLLYIYDNMRNELIERSDFHVPDFEKDKIYDVCERSKDYALQRYEHPVYDFDFGQGSGGWYKLVSRTPATLNKEEFAIFRALHKWRDDVAREQDDSVHYIMPNHMLFTLPRAVPANRAELLSTAQPATQTIRARADELVALIAEAKASSADGPDLLEVLAQIDPHHYKKALEKAASHEAAKGIAGVANFLPTKETPAEPAANGILANALLPLRSVTSMFWGASKFSADQQTRKIITAPAIALSVPLPPLTAEIFADPTTLQTPIAPSPAPVPAPQSAAAEEEEGENTFILSALSKPRKRPHSDLDPTSNTLALSPDADEAARAKAERKKARKEAKRAAAFQSMDVTPLAEEEEAFDYTTAPSILNPPRLSRDEMKAAEKARKKANPWTKSLDGPKGLGRTGKQREGGGRSVTYKS